MEAPLPKRRAVTPPPSRQERRALARAIKKRRVALTLPNVLSALEGLEEGKWWGKDGLWLCLGVRSTRQEEIRRQHSTHLEQSTAVIKYFLELHPNASWRALVTALDNMKETAMADRLRPLCERLTDPTLTAASVAFVLESVRDWELVGGWLQVPQPVLDGIKASHHGDRECKAALAEYIVSCIPGASWATVAGVLYFREERAALEAVGRKLKVEKEPSLTLRNVLSVCKGETDWYWLGFCLNVPQSKQLDILSRYHTDSDRLEAVVREWLRAHPAPSWKLLAWALYYLQKDHFTRALQRLYGKYLTAPPNVRRFGALDEVIREKGSKDENSSQLVLVGPPCSGKSSLKDRLLGRPAQKHRSTGVADEVVKIDVAIAQVSGSNWKVMNDLDDEATDLVKGIPEDAFIDFDSLSKDILTAPTPTDPTPEQAATEPATPLVVPEQPSQALSEAAPTGNDDTKPAFNPRQVFEDALPKAPPKAVKDVADSTEDCFTIYLTDTGGQPEFQGLLQSVVSGPTLFIVTFRLDKDLNTKYAVEYEHPDGNVMAPYETSFTTKETLLQLLAMISSVGSLTKTEGEKHVHLKPKVLFVGTHRDKVTSEQLLAIDRELQELVKTTDAYQEHLIEFVSEGQLILPIDNLSGDAGEVREIRAAVERIGRGDEYTVQIPYPTHVFGTAIRYLPDPILPYKDCLEIAKRCGIDTTDEFDDALWFMHHRLGVIRYFSDVPELQDLVIKSPQYIFDRVTELVVSTFTFKNKAPHKIQADFYDKGIIPFEYFEKLTASKNAAITPRQLICLLEYLHVIAALSSEAGAGTRYFAPCVLAHAKDAAADDNSSPSDVTLPPLLISFKSGYCPTGLFGVLVAHLLGSCKKMGLKWTLEEDKIYHNQITLSVGPYDAFSFTVLASHIRIELVWSIPTADRRLPLDRVCCDVRRCIEDALSEVIRQLNYTDKAEHSLGFQCPQHCHAALIQYLDGKPTNLKSCKAKWPCPLPTGSRTWFEEESSASSCQHASEQLKESDVMNAVTTLTDWFELGVQLEIPYSDLEAVERDYAHRGTRRQCRCMLHTWLQGDPEASWSKLCAALEAMGERALACDVRAKHCQ